MDFSYFCRPSVKAISIGICITTLLVTSVVATAGIKLSFGLYTSEKPTTLVMKFRPILNALEQKLGKQLKTEVRIKLSISRSYKQGIQELVSGRVDFARVGPASYILAVGKNPGISLLVMETIKGKKVFRGVICVRKDSQIQVIADLKKKRFAFGNKKSTIGRYLSQLYLRNNGIRAGDLQEYKYLGRHDRVGYAVAQGKFDAGALKESTLKKLIKKGHSLRAIAVFNNVTKPWLARKGLDPKTKAALQKALLGLTNNKALKAIKKDGFKRGSFKEYSSILTAIKENNLFFEYK